MARSSSWYTLYFSLGDDSGGDPGDGGVDVVNVKSSRVSLGRR